MPIHPEGAGTFDDVLTFLMQPVTRPSGTKWQGDLLMSTTSDYLYDHMTPTVLMRDMAFSKDAPRPGDRLPWFDLPTTDGGRINSTEFTGSRPMLLITGSLTCPMTASSNPVLKELYENYRSVVEFVMLHVREAHPGETFEQPGAYERKIEHARALKRRDRLPWPVVVDDPEGGFHHALDEKPNAVYLTDRRGVIVYRGLWAGDDKGLEQALESAAQGEVPRELESQRRLKPMAMGVGKMREMTRRSGPRAEADLWRTAPPMAALAHIADLYQPLPPHWRTAAAAATLVLGVTAVIAAVRMQRH